MTDVADFIDRNSGGTYPAFKFPNVGDHIRGTIAERPRIVAVDDLKNPGQKVDKLVIAVTTDEGDTFAVWVNGQMLGAVGEAVRSATGKTELEVGARIGIRFAELRDTGKPQPLHVFTAEYRSPAASVDVGSLL